MSSESCTLCTNNSWSMRHGFALTTMLFCVIVPKNIAGTFVSLVVWLCHMRHRATSQDAFTLGIVLCCLLVMGRVPSLAWPPARPPVRSKCPSLSPPEGQNPKKVVGSNRLDTQIKYLVTCRYINTQATYPHAPSKFCPTRARPKWSPK